MFEDGTATAGCTKRNGPPRTGPRDENGHSNVATMDYCLGLRCRMPHRRLGEAFGKSTRRA